MFSYLHHKVLIFLVEHQLNVTFTCTRARTTQGYQNGSVMFIINNLQLQTSIRSRLGIRKWCKLYYSSVSSTILDLYDISRILMQFCIINVYRCKVWSTISAFLQVCKEYFCKRAKSTFVIYGFNTIPLLPVTTHKTQPSNSIPKHFL